jgi:hypothetical protein
MPPGTWRWPRSQLLYFPDHPVTGTHDQDSDVLQIAYRDR